LRTGFSLRTGLREEVRRVSLRSEESLEEVRKVSLRSEEVSEEVGRVGQDFRMRTGLQDGDSITGLGQYCRI